jgi:hypothetical protein
MLCKADLGIVFYKITAAVQQMNQVALVLLVVKCVVKDGTFFKAVPTSTEHAGIIDDVLVGK